jgi:activator of HSP90 ATPase
MQSYKRYFTIPSTPDLVYKALTHAPTITLWTGEPAIMDEIPDSEFSWWDGAICGKNIAFTPNKEIIQEWYFGDQPDASIVTIRLHDAKGKTSLEVRQTNIPEADYENISEGWETVFGAALIDFYRV